MPKPSQPATARRRVSRQRSKANSEEILKIEELKRRALLETNKTSSLLTQLDPPKDGRVHRPN